MPKLEKYFGKRMHGRPGSSAWYERAAHSQAAQQLCNWPCAGSSRRAAAQSAALKYLGRRAC
jgi:hypothetical protein